MAIDTHGVEGEGWIGFDLDGTLAKYDKWEGIDKIGEPIKPMVDLIKKLNAEGKKVKILTARVAPRANTETKARPVSSPLANVSPYLEKSPELWTAREFIEYWCLSNLGFIPEITHEKDHLMLTMYDDRCKQVVPNKGVIVEDALKGVMMGMMVSDLAIMKLQDKFDEKKFSRHASFALGMACAGAFYLVLELIYKLVG